MVFLCWAKPSLQEQKDCLNKYKETDPLILIFFLLPFCLFLCIVDSYLLINRSNGFNYDSKYRGATSKHVSSLNELSKDGFLINHARVLVGSGVETYEKGKLALENWRSVIYFFVAK